MHVIGFQFHHDLYPPHLPVSGGSIGMGKHDLRFEPSMQNRSRTPCPSSRIWGGRLFVSLDRKVSVVEFTLTYFKKKCAQAWASIESGVVRGMAGYCMMRFQRAPAARCLIEFLDLFSGSQNIPMWHSHSISQRFHFLVCFQGRTYRYEDDQSYYIGATEGRFNSNP